MSSVGRHAVVVGGGVAGTSAAVDLADAGWQVTLLEARPRLGGAAYSFERDGLPVDTGQHVLLRCYTGYRELVARMGLADAIAPEPLDIPVLAPGRRPVRLRRGRRGPAPVHLLPALARYGALSLPERLSAIRAAAALRTLDLADPRLDAESFGTWLRRHGQGPRALDRLWGLVTVAALNTGVETASLALAAQVFRTGLLDAVDAGDVAVPGLPLSRLHHDGASALLTRLGVAVHAGCRVREVAPDPAGGAGLVVRTGDGETVADAVVLAVPHDQAARLVPARACPDREAWAGLGASAIVNVHLRYDRPVTDLAYAAVLGTAAQWVFDRTATAGGEGQYLVVSLSAADDLVDVPSAELCRQQEDALAAVLPGTAGARVVDRFVTRERRATFRQGPGTAALRPAPATRLPGLVLAGAWTGTGWPDTLEGAVRSGRAASSLLGAPPTRATARPTTPPTRATTPTTDPERVTPR